MTSMATARKDFLAFLRRFCVSPTPAPYTVFRRPIYTFSNSVVSARSVVGTSPTTAIALRNQISAVALNRAIPASFQLYQPVRSFHLTNVKEKDDKSFVLVDPLDKSNPTVMLALTIATVIFGVQHPEFVAYAAEILNDNTDIFGELESLLYAGEPLYDWVVEMLRKIVANLPGDAASVLKTMLLSHAFVKIYQLLFGSKPVATVCGGNGGGTGGNGGRNDGGASNRRAYGGGRFFGDFHCDFHGDLYFLNPVINIQNLNVYKLEKMEGGGKH